MISGSFYQIIFIKRNAISLKKLANSFNYATFIKDQFIFYKLKMDYRFKPNPNGSNFMNRYKKYLIM